MPRVILKNLFGLSLAVSGCSSVSYHNKDIGYTLTEEKKQILDEEVNQTIAEIHSSDDPFHVRSPLYDLVESYHGDLGSILYICENADSYQLECYGWASKDNPNLRNEICPELIKSAREFNNDISEDVLNAYEEQCELGTPFFLY